ncbi:hypothetical protein [Deinococcus sedimenti]|uniref:Uncharacterized protein n=1 Tax=Deinococcus sedimenti TaxID=1867090 RepID=A0ABQ2SAJ3_9DEIO|nr:hypothetical protein [Deinococcus sedimenti]GGS05660.1 hypothetical protein GCM10008960_35190 [Deinococcus sedimenti]
MTAAKVVLVGDDDVVIRPRIQAALRRLDADGAWRADEVAAQLPEAAALYSAGLLTRTSTVIGPLTHLTAAGQRRAGIDRTYGSVARQLDRAYTRLAIQAQGWTVAPDVQYLREFDCTGLMTAVQTPFTEDYGSGAALVIGKLPAGYSPSGLRHLIARFRSQALHYNFWVIVLSPQGQRGQRLAAQHPAWLKVIRVLPTGPASSVPLDIPKPVFPVKRSLQGPAVDPGQEQRALEYMAARGHPYGPLWLSIVSQPRAARAAAFRAALQVDRVICGQQLMRVYALSPEDVEDVPYVDTQVKPVHSQSGYLVQTRFYVAERRLLRRDPNFLAHAAGVAEMRVLMNVPPDPAVWRTGVTLGRREACTPDAVSIGDFGPVAVEYDTGAYTTGVIEDKLSAFRDQGYDDVVWGVPAQSRRDRLAREHDLRVKLVRWF